MATETGSGSVNDKLENILSLVLACSRGEVGNEAVENALSSIVADHAPAPSEADAETSIAPGSIIQPNIKDNIIPDDGNYDDASVDDEKIAVVDVPTEAATKATAPTSETPAKMTVKAIAKKNAAERREALEQIPLGKMGERMLITFGDGPCPNLEVVSAALLGTRASLQRAILDARALRRKLKDHWHQARAVAMMHRGKAASKDEIKKTSSGLQSSVADSELSFRAMDGFADELRFDVPCGFDVPQLETLFPEEMGAYQKWKKLHDAYTENSEDVSKKSTQCDGASDQEDVDELVPGEVNSDRLLERLSNFDVRTNNMGGDWYLKFADNRRGSFLPRFGARKSSSETSEGKEQEQKKRGRPSSKSRISWQNLHPASVIFLHWVGFDPMSALSPPNEETTQVLGYLAYDFFGKIVEKAVSLRLEGNEGKDGSRKPRRSNSPSLELVEGDQLDKGNIEEAISETKLSSLYSSSNIDLGKSAKIAQLYFGPGFEDRLELEMDEIFGSKEKLLSQEELKARKDEESLFSELPELPTLLSNVAEVIDNNHSDEIMEGSSKKSRTDK